MANDRRVLFGWCGDNHHDECIQVLPSFPDVTCDCECHNKQSTEPTTKEQDNQ